MPTYIHRVDDLLLFNEVVEKGGFSAAESYAWHRRLLETKGDVYDPRVRSRIMRGAEQSAAEYIDLLNRRSEAIAAYAAAMRDVDAIVMPTVPIIPPRIGDLERDEDFTTQNLLVLRNTLIINVLDGCSISVPMTSRGAAPCGLMLSSTAGSDHRLLGIAAAVEAQLGVA